MNDFSKIDQYLEENLQASISELSRLCAQPSVGAQNWGLRECADLVAEMLHLRGFSVEVLPTDGAPVVFAERKGRHNRTILFYNHYDVQPPDWMVFNSRARRRKRVSRWNSTNTVFIGRSPGSGLAGLTGEHTGENAARA